MADDVGLYGRDLIRSRVFYDAGIEKIIAEITLAKRDIPFETATKVGAPYPSFEFRKTYDFPVSVVIHGVRTAPRDTSAHFLWFVWLHLTIIQP